MSTIRSIALPSDLEPLLARSWERPVWVFKHSLTCGISARARRQFEAFVASRPADAVADHALLEIQRARELSARLAAATGVRHQSPQALLLRDGRAVWHASHGRISAAALAAAETETELPATAPPAAGG